MQKIKNIKTDKTENKTDIQIIPDQAQILLKYKTCKCKYYD